MGVPSGIKVIDQSSNKSSHALNRSLPSSSNKFSLASSIKNYNKNKSNNSLRSSTYNNSNNNNPFFNETTTTSSVQTNDNVSSFKSRLPRSNSNVSQGSVGIIEFPRSHSRSRIPTKTTSSGGSRPESRCSGLSK